MITGVVAPVLLDVLVPGARFGAESEARLARAAEAGALSVCPLVVAELSAHFAKEAELRAFLRDTGIRVDPFGLASLHLAGQTWRSHSKKHRPDPRASDDGAARGSVITDFMVGAHASTQAERLL